MEFTTIEFELDMQALFNSYLHLNWSISIWLLPNVCYDEFFLFCYPIVVSIDDYVDIITKSYHNSVVALKLLFNPVELKIILNAI